MERRILSRRKHWTHNLSESEDNGQGREANVRSIQSCTLGSLSNVVHYLREIQSDDVNEMHSMNNPRSSTMSLIRILIRMSLST